MWKKLSGFCPGSASLPDRIQGFVYQYSKTDVSFKNGQSQWGSLKELSKIEKQDALILDDFGVQPFDDASRALLLDIIEDRHRKRSTTISAQVPVKKWHEVIEKKTIADAIMDRIVHQSIRIELYGESLQKKQKAAKTAMESFL